MTWVDLAALALLAISGLLAFVRGLVREVLGIGAWAGAVAGGIAGVPMMRNVLRQWISSPAWIDPAGFFIIFVILLIVLTLTARAIGSVVRASALGGVDRTLGLVFGLARGAVVIMIGYILAGMVFPIDHWPAVVLQARTLEPTYRGAKWMRDQLPEDYRPRIYAPPATRETTADTLLHLAPQGYATGRMPARE